MSDAFNIDIKAINTKLKKDATEQLAMLKKLKAMATLAKELGQPDTKLVTDFMDTAELALKDIIGKQTPKLPG